ncbi:methyl-accepting chemotaxis protein [Desulfosarcina ovata subsp. ovata]|uniref:Methyl-accepting chemotaxis protein n=2 Tax=Desulfosarcina ovata TaxID=83564 RepID=A0A5K8AEX5_9BACT|nr:methyl-accepting chemotaxis protein [Desulfosarcina ovata subsp. ovata]
MMKMNIRNKFLLPTILLIIVGMGVSATISYVKSKNALSNALLENIQQRTRSTATNLESWIKDRQLDLRSWSHEEIYAKATKTSIIGKAARISANEKLARLQAEYGYYEDICLAGEDGMVIAANAEKIVGKINVKDREYYKAAMAGNTYVSDVSLSRNSGNPVFFVSTPVQDNKQIKGVLFGVVSITQFSKQFIDNIKVGQSGYAFAVNENGFVIAHPDRSKIMKENINKYDFGKQMLAQKNGLLNYTYSGAQKELAFKAIKEQGWIVAVNVPEAEILAPVKSLGMINLMVAVVVIAVATVLIYFVTSTVVKPINRVVAGLQDAAEGDGDLTKRIDINSTDEVGELALWFNTFIEKIQRIIADVAQNAQNLTTASKELATIAEHLSESVDRTSGKTITVSAASEQMSTTISSAAGIMDETASNLNIVASGAEEMTATISEIAGNTEKGRQIAEEAVGQTTHATNQIEELGNAAMQIGKVVETITEISEQVNLLALNATIEAARAGEAGKGFAVVANEIKELAKQTAAASGEIKLQIEGIQNSTQGTVTEINSIAKVVGTVNELVSTIAAAVEEQSVTTKDIAGNVAKASEGMGEVNTTIAESSEAANSIAADITDVTQAADEMTNVSAQVNASSKDLFELAETLNVMVKQFRV